jgi:3-phenylpropionate/trans-cinnamate dioxygenase ferredoxin subunit
MAEYVAVAQVEEVKPGERIVLDVKEHYVALFNVDGTYYAIEDLCTHDDGPLGDGELTGTIIECPRHGAQFDITTGKVVRMPAITPIPRYDVRVVDGTIQILI